jgi:hypothetical protein
MCRIHICLADYGASDAIYLCTVVEKIQQYFGPKNAPLFLENKISRGLTTVGVRYFQSLQDINF